MMMNEQEYYSEDEFRKFYLNDEETVSYQVQDYLVTQGAHYCGYSMPEVSELEYHKEYSAFLHSFFIDEKRKFIFLNMVFFVKNLLVKKRFTYSYKNIKFIDELISPLGFVYDELPLLVGEIITAKIEEGQIEDRLVITGFADYDKTLEYITKNSRYPGKHCFDDILYCDQKRHEIETLKWVGDFANLWDLPEKKEDLRE